MNPPESIHNRMFRDLKERVIFDKALQYSNTYLDEVLDRNIFPTEEALQNLQNFEEGLPIKGADAQHILKKLHDYGAPASVAQLGGRYFGFVNGSALPAALAAKLMADFWDQNPAMYVISPITSKLETVVEKWLVELFGLPQGTVAGFVSGSSNATFCGLAAARYRILKRHDWDVNKKGLIGAPMIRIVAGKHIHGSVLKAIGLLGLGTDLIEWVDCDDQGRIIPSELPDLDQNTIVILQAGNVNSGSFDDFEEVCEKADKANAWVHIDGAFGLWAAATNKLAYLTKGIGMASSWSVDGHKTLNTPYDSGIALCADKEAVVGALHASGAYLVLGKERDGMFYTTDMSRRARAVELWAAVKYLGKEGMDEMIFTLHERALQFAKELNVAGFEIPNKVVFNQVLVYCESDELTTKILSKVQELRVCWCGGSEWDGKKVIRISVCSWATTQEDVSMSVRSFIQARDEVKKNLNNPSLILK